MRRGIQPSSTCSPRLPSGSLPQELTRLMDELSRIFHGPYFPGNRQVTFPRICVVKHSRKLLAGHRAAPTRLSGSHWLGFPLAISARIDLVRLTRIRMAGSSRIWVAAHTSGQSIHYRPVGRCSRQTARSSVLGVPKARWPDNWRARLQPPSIRSRIASAGRPRCRSRKAIRSHIAGLRSCSGRLRAGVR
jgi:hypothetical protein